MNKVILKAIIFLGGFLAIEASVSCHVGLCNDLEPSDYDQYYPNPGRLDEICLSMDPFLNCIREKKQRCPDLRGVPQHLMYDTPRAVMTNVFLGLLDLYTELCNKNSDIRKAYIEHGQCIINVTSDVKVTDQCHFDAKERFTAYVANTGQSNLGVCFTQGHVFGCIYRAVQTRCGDAAHNVAVEMLKLERVLKYLHCSQQQFQDLKTTYLDYLDLNTESRRSFEKTFDL